jgi:hypothetical protein
MLTQEQCYGSLYFAADAFAGCKVAKVTGVATLELNDYVASNFVIGPIAEKAFNEDDPQQDEMERGPCEFQESLLVALRIDQLTLV